MKAVSAIVLPIALGLAWIESSHGTGAAAPEAVVKRPSSACPQPMPGFVTPLKKTDEKHVAALAGIPLVEPPLVGSVHYDVDPNISIIEGTLDRIGHIYLLDTTGAVHVLDEQGRVLHVDTPGPKDLQGTNPSLAVSANGDVYVHMRRPTDESGKDTIVHFASDGRRVGIEPAMLNAAFEQSWLSQPDGSKRWILEGLERIDLAGAEGIISHVYSGRLGHVGANRVANVAPDGSLGIVRDEDVDRGTSRSSSKGFQLIADVYTPEGKLLVSWPVQFPIDDLARGFAAFDGERWALSALSGQFALKTMMCGQTYDFEKSVIVVLDPSGKPLFRFMAEGGPIFLVGGHSGRELWVPSDKRTFDRYSIR